ncbi:hypothetical protein WJX73_006058 [Symbiochloris irregularis]|uniref:Uncharacterized protein n=1 Tax=Symbiochloris irregularis TaxID=706552 RepID=A0AAW1PHK3_9CHLO
MRKTSSSDEELTRLVKEYRSALAGSAAGHGGDAHPASLQAKPARKHTRSSSDDFTAVLAQQMSGTQGSHRASQRPRPTAQKLKSSVSFNTPAELGPAADTRAVSPERRPASSEWTPAQGQASFTFTPRQATQTEPQAHSPSSQAGASPLVQAVERATAGQQGTRGRTPHVGRSAGWDGSVRSPRPRHEPATMSLVGNRRAHAGPDWQASLRHYSDEAELGLSASDEGFEGRLGDTEGLSDELPADAGPEQESGDVLQQLHSSIEAMRTDCNSTANRIVGVVERLSSRVAKLEDQNSAGPAPDEPSAQGQQHNLTDTQQAAGQQGTTWKGSLSFQMKPREGQVPVQPDAGDYPADQTRRGRDTVRQQQAAQDHIKRMATSRSPCRNTLGSRPSVRSSSQPVRPSFEDRLEQLCRKLNRLETRQSGSRRSQGQTVRQKEQGPSLDSRLKTLEGHFQGLKEQGAKEQDLAERVAASERHTAQVAMSLVDMPTMPS